MQQVHIRVNDAATGKPTPVRLRVTDADGKYYAPLGRLETFATGPNKSIGGNVLLDDKAWAYIDGACEVSLPSGPLHVNIAKGPEYRPIEADVNLIPGKLALRFQIERWHDLRQQGWFSGDTRVHFLPPHAALLEAQAEDVAVVQLLARVTQESDAEGQHSAIPNLLAFSGQSPCLQAPGHLLAVNTENFHPVLDSLSLPHCHRVVYPLTFGGPAGQDDWTLEDWCGQCHRKKGLVVWTRTAPGGGEFRCGEPLVDLLLGQVDAFEIAGDFEASRQLWYDLLNFGLHVPLAGASGKDSNAAALGSMRTYVQLPTGQELTLPTWIEGLRAGLSFITNGPLLNFTVNGQGPGSVVQTNAAALRVQAEAKGRSPGQRLSIVRNGLEIAVAQGGGDPTTATLEINVPVDRSCWLAAQCSGDAFAHTSPIYVDVPQRPFSPDRDAAARLLHEVERMIAWCRTEARCSTEQLRERLLAGFLKAKTILVERGG